jgi:hypothetical protein
VTRLLADRTLWTETTEKNESTARELLSVASETFQT